MKGKKGQAIFLSIMVFIIVFAAAIQLIPSIKIQVDDARSASKLNCTSADLSVGEQGGCILVDLVLPYFFGIVIAGAAAYFTLRRGQFG